MNSALVRAYLLSLQERITQGLQELTGDVFAVDAWQREPGGSLRGDGQTRWVENGQVLERGGCNFSHVTGAALPAAATLTRPALAGAAFEAMGVSVVLHPRNPYAPTVHLNVRMFSATPVGQAGVTWFGGGMDLTPCYGFESDAREFHQANLDALAPFGVDKYPRFKTWCDDYFFLKHRGETRGVGGIFFDDFFEGGFERSFALIRAVGDAFMPVYARILKRRMGQLYTERERDFLLYRRGRYVEFNLVLDRGTLFGLQSGGRTESILISMPPLAAWRYGWSAEPGSPEEQLAAQFLKPRDWLG